MKHVIDTVSDYFIRVQRINIHHVKILIDGRKSLKILCNLEVMVFTCSALRHYSSSESKYPESESQEQFSHYIYILFIV